MLILKAVETLVRVAAVVRAGVQVDAGVRFQRDRGAQAAVDGHQAAVAAPAAVVVVDHRHLSSVSWNSDRKGLHMVCVLESLSVFQC